MYYLEPRSSPNREDTRSEDRDLLQIGEFARVTGSNLRTIRYYEELGLLTPASRSAGGFRHYKRSQLDRMVSIKRLQALGLSLKEISQQIALTESRIQTMKTDLEKLQESHRRLVETCKSCDQPFSRENCDPCSRGHGELSSVLRGLL